ncbi:MAG: hypothetical protein CUN56_04005 [Phototrophicales bacterium]|nr:MAG: hypothetical protein CUN56_04005 [Phototrophicales bacterium]RMG71177.1 MAG: CPBP family intramembrane metalloprotease [Chloroflexota bacterium]
MFITLMLVIGYIGFTIYAANMVHLKSLTKNHDFDPDYEKQKQTVKLLLFGGVSLTGLCGVFVVLSAAAANDPNLAQENIPNISTWEILFGVGTAVICGVASYAVVVSHDTRQALHQRIRTFDPQSLVHITAVVLSLLVLTAQIAQFVAIGGVDGLAESYAEFGIRATDLLFELFLRTAAAFLGVGYAIRRDLFESLHRLGLRYPTPDDVRYGLFVGFGFFGIAIVYGVLINILTAIFPVLDELNAANDNLVLSVTTIPMAILLAASAAIGEEILFRGALQPVFGNWLTSLFFVLLHTQILLTPGIVLLFFVSYGLGWVRQEQSTTAAIIAHFVYNFAQLLIVVLLIG